MGTSLIKLGFYRREKTVLMVGEVGSGKTTIASWIQENHMKRPLIGYALESVEYKNLSISCYDFPVAEKIKPLLRLYLEGKGGLIVTVDSSVCVEFEQLLQDLGWLLQEPQMLTVPVMLVWTKVEVARTEEWVSEGQRARLKGVVATNNRKWMEVETGLQARGELVKGLEWMANL
jgi:signal recognition particle receptor subunit beta